MTSRCRATARHLAGVWAIRCRHCGMEEWVQGHEAPQVRHEVRTIMAAHNVLGLVETVDDLLEATGG